MYKAKIKNVILTLILFTTFILFVTGIFIKQSFEKSVDKQIEEEEGIIKITSDTKDLTSKNTQDIIFEVQDNSNIKNGKIAPGSKAIATIQLDLNKASYEIDFVLQADTSKLGNNLKISSKIDNEPYVIGDTKIFKLENEKKIITLMITWENDTNINKMDTLMAVSNDTITIPITWIAKQHI